MAKASSQTFDNEEIQRLVVRCVWNMGAGADLLVETLILSSYIDRDNDELGRLKSERRPGRPPSNREDLLKQRYARSPSTPHYLGTDALLARIATEQGEYSSGFWIPDLSDESNLEKLRVWNEEWSSLGQISFIRIHKDGRALPSSFPPKSLS